MAAAVIVIVGTLGSAPAVAGTATMTSGGRLAYDAAPGERNKLALRAETSPEGVQAWLIRDGVGLTAARGCSRLSATSARCPLSAGTPRRRPVLRLGNENDGVRVDLGAHVLAGSGADTIRIRDGRVRVNPGPGRDVVDFLSSRAPRPPIVAIHARDRQSDWIQCGHGRDTVALDSLDFADAACDRVRRRGAARAVLARSVSLFAEDIEPDLVSVSQVGCPSDFGRPACRVWFTIAQPGGVALDTLGVEKQAAGEFGSSQPLIERNVFAFDLSRGSDSWSARVLLTLHSRDAKGRPYSLRQRARLVVSEATCEC